MWYQGGQKPKPPKPYIDLTKSANGALFEGTKGMLLADFSSRMLFPSDGEGDLTYYKRRSPEQLLPLISGSGPDKARGLDALFQKEWIDACKGSSKKTTCDFDYSGTLMEQMLLGLVAQRAGQKLQYDAATGRVTNAPEANEYLIRKYRAGWTLNG